jgi:hypothetical protein
VSPDRRAPWWYSGDDEEPPDEESSGSGRVPEPAADPEPSAGDGEDAPSMDWTALVAGAARMVDWATERVMAPHAEHMDPADHPDCMVCRTVTLIGDPVGLMTAGQRAPEDEGPAAADEGGAAPAPRTAERPVAEPIRWIPIVESRD